MQGFEPWQNRNSKLTMRAVENLKAKGSNTVCYDGELSGFGICIRKWGRKNPVLQTRVCGKLRGYTIGQHGRVTVGEARAAMIEILAQTTPGQVETKPTGKIQHLSPNGLRKSEPPEADPNDLN